MSNTNLKKWCIVLAGLCMTGTAGAVTTAAETPQASQATSVCKGVVVDSEGEPVIGASVRVDGTKISVATDVDGHFTLPGIKHGASITISYIGSKSQTVKWNGSALRVVLQEDSNTLDELVILGYGVTQKRAKVTNSVSKVTEDNLTIGQNANPAQALVGAVSGVKVDVTSGSPSATPSITLRGGTNYDSGSNEPLVVVDGVIRSSLSDINPNDIEDMQILKDSGATAIYGARAGNGVILITTKQGKAGSARINFSAKLGLNDYSDIGYTMCTDEDYLYYYRTALCNTQWMLPGGNYSSSLNTMLYNTNQPGGIGRTELSNTQSFNILRKTDDNAYLLEKGWKEMRDPVSENYILYKNDDILSINTNQPAVTQDYNASVSGGNDRGKYYASLGYYDAEGAIKDTFYKRYNFALTGSYKLNKWLEANSIFNYTRANWLNDDPMLTTTYFFNRAMGYKFVRYRDEDGNDLYGFGNPTYNVNVNSGNFERDYQSDKFSMTQGLTATILPGLTLKGTMSWFYNEYVAEYFNHAYVTSQAGAENPDGTSGVNRTYASSNTFYRYFNQTYNLVANYNKTFNEAHTVNAMLGMEYYDSSYRYMYAYGYGAPTGDFQDLSLTQNDSDVQSRSIDSAHSKEALLSYFGRFEYDYKDKYLLAATFREDGYSRLINNRWGFFPGVSAGWVFTKENFFNEIVPENILNYGKLRSSFGYNATINSSYLGYYTLQGAYSAYKYDGNIGYRISTLPNPDLKWEKTRTFEVGLDLGFLKNRFNLGMTYYNRTTLDKYASLALPQTTGYSSVTYNNGQYRNQGIELDLNATLLRTKDFSWTFGGNIAYNTNKIVKLPENGEWNNMLASTTTEVYVGPGVYEMNDDGSYALDSSGNKVYATTYIGGYYEGANPYEFVGYKDMGILRTQEEIDALGDYIDTTPTYGAGVYATEAGRQRLLALGYSAANCIQLMPGDLYFADRNGDNKIDSQDRYVLGHLDPHWTGGFNTTLTWKGLSLYARFDMGFGFQVYDSNIAFWLGEGQGAMAFNDDIRNTWTPDNPGAKYPRVTWASQFGTDNYIRTNSFFVQNGNYLACRELSLSYQLPMNICRKFSCQGLQLSVTGQNLGYIKSCTIPLPDNTTYTSGNTAGNGGTYNLPRTVIFGLNLSF